MDQTTDKKRTTTDDADVIGNIDAATAAAGSDTTGKQQNSTADPSGLEALLRQRLPFWAHWERLDRNGTRDQILHLVQHLAEATNAVILDGNGRPIDVHTKDNSTSAWGIKWTTSAGQWALGFGPDDDGDDLYVLYVEGPHTKWRGAGITADQAIIKLEALDVFPSSSGTING